MIAALAAVLVLQVPAAADAADADAARRRLGEDAVRARLIDPDSAKFEWYSQPFIEITNLHHGLFGKYCRRSTDARVRACNSKNRMGGYSGFSVFDVVLKDGSVVETQMDVATDDLQATAQFCTKMGFTTLSAVQSAAAPASPLHFGATFVTLPGAVAVAVARPDLRGVLVMVVQPQSPAQAAGLQAGDTITAFGGRPITTTVEMQAAVAGADPTRPVVVEIVRGGKPVELRAELR